VDSTISATAASAVANLPPVAAVAAPNLPLLADNELDSGKDNNSAAGAQREGESSTAAATVNVVVGDIVLHYLIECINDVEPHIRHHAILFCQKLIPVFVEASAQFFLISREKNNTIIGSLKHIQDGQPLSFFGVSTLTFTTGIRPIHHCRWSGWSHSSNEAKIEFCK
jgi:hypothetical protein